MMMAKPAEGKLLPKQEFYMYVGLCITAWAKVEDELFDICVDVLGCTQERASIVYYRTPTVSARLELVDELVLSALPRRTKKNGGHEHEDVKRWKAIKSDLVGMTTIRRKIAHHPVNHAVAMRLRDTGELAPVGQPVPIDNLRFENSYWIYRSSAEGLRGRDGGHRPLKTDDLSVHCAELEIIAPKIRDFRAARLMSHIREAARQESMRERAKRTPNVRLTIGKPKPTTYGGKGGKPGE
jgi:hypothetical protein